MLNLFTKLFEFFARAAEPDEPEDFDPEDESLWGGDPFAPETERVELYENIGGKRYA